MTVPAENTSKNPKLRNAGFILFFLSGICAISSGIIVSLLRENYGLSFSSTGTLLSILSAGNIAASFLAGVLPGRIGSKASVLLLTIGYFLGYMLCACTGSFALLSCAFLLIGLAKGGAINNCNVMVGTNAQNRTKAMNVLHACYAAGALLCPFLIQFFTGIHAQAPMIGIAAAGLLMWFLFLQAKLPEEKKSRRATSAGSSEAIKKQSATAAADAQTSETDKAGSYAFLRDATFWILTALVFCQNAAEQSVNGWLVTYFKTEGILRGTLANYTVTIMWGATLLGRLLIAFVLPIRNLYKTLSIMGLGLTVLYAVLVGMHTPISASIALFLFAFAMAGVNPLALSGVGQMMSTASMGVLLSTATIGAILMPYITGRIGDAVSLQAGMAANLVPCVGILLLSFLMYRRTARC